MHPTGGYPPLAVPPGPPPADIDDDVDGGFERKLLWLLLLLLLFALLLTGVNLTPGPAWAEMPTDRVLLTVDRGRISAEVDGRTVTLAEGGRRYLAQGAQVRVAARSTGRLTFRGGAVTLLCSGSDTAVGKLWTSADQEPHGELTVDNGRLLADTTSTSGAFRPLTLVVRRTAGDVQNKGPAWYAVDPGAVAVATGEVRVGGAPAAPAGTDLSCGDGVPVAPPAGAPSESPSSDAPLPSQVPTEVTPSATPTTTTTTPAVTPTPTRGCPRPCRPRSRRGPRPRRPARPGRRRPPPGRPPTPTPSPSPSPPPSTSSAVHRRRSDGAVRRFRRRSCRLRRSSGDGTPLGSVHRHRHRSAVE